MDRQQGFVLGVGSRGRPIEAPSDHSFVIDHGVLLMDLTATGEMGGVGGVGGRDALKWLLQRC